MIERWGCYERNWLRKGSGPKAPPHGRGALIALLAPVLVLLAACQEQIVHDLSEREANTVVSQLSVAHLDARKVQQPDGRWAISVEREQMVQALSLIETRRVLPSRDAPSVSNRGGMIPSREEQRFRYERSVALSIEESLSALPGVLDARVHLNLPDDDPLFGDAARKGGSGSVLLVVEHGFAASDEEVSALVGGAAGLPREVVRVLKSKTVEGRALPSEESARAPVPPPQGASISPVVWPIAMTLVGGSALIGLGMRGGMRFLRARSKRRVKFELPKELDFEG